MTDETVAVNVAYLTFNEAVWLPLLRRQVIELISELRARRKGKLYLISFISAVDYFRNRRHIEDVRTKLRSAQITPLIFPALTPFPLPYVFPLYRRGEGWSRMHYMTAATLPFLLLHTLPLLLIMRFLFQVRIFHCRSYAAAVPALAGKLLCEKWGFIFDPRSDYPEENVTAGTWSLASRSFAAWKGIEKKCVERADYVICITEEYKEHFRATGGRDNLVVIPNNVDARSFAGAVTDHRRLKLEQGLENTLVFCYLGSLASNSWHNPAIYAKAIKEFRVLPHRHTFLFLIPPDSRPPLMQALAASGISPEEYLIRHPGYHEVPLYLGLADFGVMFLDRYKICLGTKVAEYITSGLPVLVNENVAGASPLVERNRLGSVINIGAGGRDREVSVGKIKEIASHRFDRETIRRFGAENFSNEVVAAKYGELYANLARR